MTSKLSPSREHLRLGTMPDKPRKRLPAAHSPHISESQGGEPQRPLPPSEADPTSYPISGFVRYTEESIPGSSRGCGMWDSECGGSFPVPVNVSLQLSLQRSAVKEREKKRRRLPR